MVGADPACFFGDHRRAVLVLRNTQSIGPRRTIGKTELDANAEARGRATPRQFPQNRSQSVPRFYYLLKRFMHAVGKEPKGVEEVGFARAVWADEERQRLQAHLAGCDASIVLDRDTLDPCRHTPSLYAGSRAGV